MMVVLLLYVCRENTFESVIKEINHKHGYTYNYGTFINANKDIHSVYVYKTCVHNKYVYV